MRFTSDDIRKFMQVLNERTLAPGEEEEDAGNAALLPLVRGMTPEHTKMVASFVAKSGIGTITAHPKFTDRVIFVPAQRADHTNTIDIVEAMLKAVSDRFKTQPFYEDKWTIMAAPAR